MHNLHELMTVALSTMVSMVSEKSSPLGVDMSIESMSTESFSTGMFYFLLFAIFVFVVIVFMFMFKGKGANLKFGEKVLFIWIMLGVVAAVVFGSAQMMQGYLF